MVTPDYWVATWPLRRLRGFGPGTDASLPIPEIDRTNRRKRRPPWWGRDCCAPGWGEGELFREKSDSSAYLRACVVWRRHRVGIGTGNRAAAGKISDHLWRLHQGLRQYGV